MTELLWFLVGAGAAAATMLIVGLVAILTTKPARQNGSTTKLDDMRHHGRDV